MSTTQMVGFLPTAATIRDEHARLVDGKSLLARRRALYAAMWETAAGPDSWITDPPLPILDDPMIRGALGSFMEGRIKACDVPSVEERRLIGTALSTAAGQLRVTTRTADANAVAPALGRISAELGRHGAEDSLRLLAPSDERNRWAVDTLVTAAALLNEVVPELASDILPHVGLVAIVEPGAGRRLGSASVREYPGLVVLPCSTDVLEYAEALIHEGAHQKFFDLAMTGSMISPDAFTIAESRPSWSPVDGPGWAFSQRVAAFHAYICLAALASNLAGTPHPPPRAGSLLPHSGDRARELGDWLRDNVRGLGGHGRRLIGALSGVELPEPAVEERFAPPSDQRCATRWVDEWFVHVACGNPPEAWWGGVLSPEPSAS